MSRGSFNPMWIDLVLLPFQLLLLLVLAPIWVPIVLAQAFKDKGLPEDEAPLWQKEPGC